jgi:histidine triad (HIT) family protein
MNCLFCKIANDQVPAQIVYRDDLIVAFNDVNPQAAHHILVIPKKHIATLNDLHNEDAELIGYIVQSAVKLASQFNIAEDGYRLVMNCNANGGQTVFHVHAHLLGGRQMTWPPG